MSVTINDIAQRAGVSTATVSRVLNNKPDVRPSTIERVRRAIRELNYSPSTAARGLVLQKTKVLGFIVPDIASPNFPELARGIIAASKRAGYSVMLFDTNHDDEIVRETISLLQSKQVDGIVLSFDSANRDELIRLKKIRFPVVQIYRKSPEITVPTISIDNARSGYIATRHLIDRGHRRIAHITTGDRTQSGSERLKGYRSALAEAGISWKPDLVRTGSHSYDAGRDCMTALLGVRPSPTAVFASHDLMALGAYEAIADAGLRVPDDVSVVGHDNIDMSRMVLPKLTSVDTFKFTLGQEGIRLLLSEIEHKTMQAVERVFPTALVLRDSVRTLI